MELVNCVATADVKARINLDLVARHVEHTEYDPEAYYALIFRNPRFPVSLLANTSGKIVFSGGKSLDACRKALAHFNVELRSLGIDAKDSEIEIRNLVFKTHLGAKLQLYSLERLSPWYEVEYEPEQFPGVILRAKPGTALIFSSGACMIQGIAKEAEARALLTYLVDRLHAIGALT